MPAMPPIRRMIDAIDHSAEDGVIVLPTIGSCGQLLVYEWPVSPGRSVADDHDDQKKKPASAFFSELREVGSADSVQLRSRRSKSG